MAAKSILLIVMLPFFAMAQGDKYLSDVPRFSEPSYFKDTVYAEHNWRSFYNLKEPGNAVQAATYDIHLLNAAVFFATNKLRNEKGLKPLLFDAALRNAAMLHCNEMVTKKFFDHFNNRVHKLHSPEDRLKLYGITNREMAENIDLTSVDDMGKITYLQLADMIVKDFYNSAPHRKTMLSKTLTHLGCAALLNTPNKDHLPEVKTTQDFYGH
jgi:uncharacterized protein YkwD